MFRGYRVGSSAMFSRTRHLSTMMVTDIHEVINPPEGVHGVWSICKNVTVVIQSLIPVDPAHFPKQEKRQVCSEITGYDLHVRHQRFLSRSDRCLTFYKLSIPLTLLNHALRNPPQCQDPGYSVRLVRTSAVRVLCRSPVEY